MSIQNYIAMHIIEELGKEKVYLKDIAQKMQLTIPQVSKLAAALQESGLIHWSHEGDGSDGTFVTITRNGDKVFTQQKAFLEDFYSRVIEKFGIEKVQEMLKLMEEFENLVSRELA